MKQTLDDRVALAGEYLAGARRRKVTELPASVLMRELAETRRQFGQVLDVIREQATACATQAATQSGPPARLRPSGRPGRPPQCRRCTGRLMPHRARAA